MRPLVLLIDDHDDSLAVCGSCLEHCGYGVLLARTPDEGIALAREHSPDVIVTELFRRTQVGWYTPETFQGDSRTRHIPVLGLSAWCLDDDRRRALASGCAHFLAKPITPSMLSSAISVLVDLSEPLPPMPN